jgi:hypothetical protein
MPTPAGLPRAGEVWERTIKLPQDAQPETVRFVVLHRNGGEYWSLLVWVPGQGRQLWVDPAYWLAKGWLRYIGTAGPRTRAELGLASG